MRLSLTRFVVLLVDMREVVLPDLVIDNVCYSLLVIYKRRVNRLPLKVCCGLKWGLKFSEANHLP